MCIRDRDDALHATRAAVEEGIVPGGGVAPVSYTHLLGGRLFQPFPGGGQVLFHAEAVLVDDAQVVLFGDKSPGCLRGSGNTAYSGSFLRSLRTWQEFWLQDRYHR